MKSGLGDRIKKYRKYKDVTQEKLAQMVGVSKWTVINWESNKRMPSADKFYKIAEALGIPPTSLMDDDARKKYQIERFNYINYGDAPEDNTSSWGNTTSTFEKSAIPVLEKTVMLPVLSPEQTACCGEGMLALDITSWEGETAIVPLSDIGAEYDNMRPPFVICTDGDSMTEWSIPNGSRVVINPAEEVRSMDIALVNYMGKLALKKVRFNRDKSIDLLSSDGNTMHIEPEDAVPEVFNVVGKAMSLTSRIRHGI